jgi:hypothetical protein
MVALVAVDLTTAQVAQEQLAETMAVTVVNSPAASLQAVAVVELVL